jgi:hypothetical protein
LYVTIGIAAEIIWLALDVRHRTGWVAHGIAVVAMLLVIMCKSLR